MKAVTFHYLNYCIIMHSNTESQRAVRIEQSIPHGDERGRFGRRMRLGVRIIFNRLLEYARRNASSAQRVAV